MANMGKQREQKEEDMLNWTGVVHKVSTYKQKLHVTEESCEPEGSPPQGRRHQLIVQCQMINFENIHTSHTICIQQVILRGIYVYTNRCMNVTTIDEKEAMNKKEQGSL